MSDIFLKKTNKNSNVSDFLDTENVSNTSLPQWLSVVDIPKKGGNSTSVSEVESATSTTELESKLREIFKEADQDGGGKKKTGRCNRRHAWQNNSSR